MLGAGGAQSGIFCAAGRQPGPGHELSDSVEYAGVKAISFPVLFILGVMETVVGGIVLYTFGLSCLQYLILHVYDTAYGVQHAQGPWHLPARYAYGKHRGIARINCRPR